MRSLRAATIAKLIYPAGFYRRKAEQIREISRMLLERHDGRVPADLDLLLELPGVGRKTANLVLTLGFDKPGICVDIHVHRICNRLGWVRTKQPADTEQVLRRVLPPRFWPPINARPSPAGWTSSSAEVLPLRGDVSRRHALPLTVRWCRPGSLPAHSSKSPPALGPAVA